MNVNEFLQATKHTGKGFKPRKRMYCADGWNVSVQAGDGMYSYPRSNDADEYHAVELGYPSAGDERLREYADTEKEDMTQDVFGYVPVHVLQAIADDHGGIVTP